MGVLLCIYMYMYPVPLYMWIVQGSLSESKGQFPTPRLLVTGLRIVLRSRENTWNTAALSAFSVHDFLWNLFRDVCRESFSVRWWSAGVSLQMFALKYAE